jgi:hypothetical protein
MEAFARSSARMAILPRCPPVFAHLQGDRQKLRLIGALAELLWSA